MKVYNCQFKYGGLDTGVLLQTGQD